VVAAQQAAACSAVDELHPRHRSSEPASHGGGSCGWAVRGVSLRSAALGAAVRGACLAAVRVEVELPSRPPLWVGIPLYVHIVIFFRLALLLVGTSVVRIDPLISKGRGGAFMVVVPPPPCCGAVWSSNGVDSLLIGFPRNKSVVLVAQGVFLHLARSDVPAALLLRLWFLSWLMWWQHVDHANLPLLEHALTCGAGDLTAKAPRPVRGEVSDLRMFRRPLHHRGLLSWSSSFGFAQRGCPGSPCSVSVLASGTPASSSRSFDVVIKSNVRCIHSSRPSLL
jgi:hypothetical protein